MSRGPTLPAAYYRPTVSRALTTDAPVIDALHGGGGARPRWGFWKCFDRLWLNLPRRTRKRVPQRVRHPLAAPAQLNHTRALDFMSDTLYDG